MSWSDNDATFFLRACGSVAKYWRHRKLFYALKDAILKRYGTFYAYDLQEWDDESLDWPGEVFATHSHILKVFRLGNTDFHIPTDEFAYYNQWGRVKASEHFDHFLKLVRGKMDGKKAYTSPRPEHYRMLKYLVRNYGHLIK